MNYEKYKQKMLDCLRAIADVRDNDGIKHYVELVDTLTSIQFHNQYDNDQSNKILQFVLYLTKLLARDGQEEVKYQDE